MRKKFKKMVVSLVLTATMLLGTSLTAYAATQEIQGSEDKTQSVEVTATIQSVYSVSLPATVELSYDVLSNVYVGDTLKASAEGYWGSIVYGCAGKISNSEYVFIRPTFPCTMTSVSSSATVALQKVLPSTGVEPKTTWNHAEIGTADFNGVSLTNCQYAYSEGLTVGFLLDSISAYENYRGTLVFSFGIRAN